jgi:hypothetical protein
MIPCTPFILAGAITFPDMQIFIMVISYIGIVVGAFLVYSFPSFGNYDQLLEHKYPDKIAMLREKDAWQSTHFGSSQAGRFSPWYRRMSSVTWLGW